MKGSKIEWTDHTFNPWIGCQKVSTGCDKCYAEKWADHVLHRVQWGPRGVRDRTSPANWRQPRVWNRKAIKAGRRDRVFCASLADVFDNKAPPGAREDLWDLIRETPGLDWQILTKRPQNIAKMLPPDWGEGWPHVWLGATMENQTEYDRRWPILSAVPAKLHYVSHEPALGPLDITGHDRVPAWLIWGAETGAGARPTNPDWVRALIEDCADRGVALFLKQWGLYTNNPLVLGGMPAPKARLIDPPSNGKGGALLDGDFVRAFPVSPALEEAA